MDNFLAGIFIVIVYFTPLFVFAAIMFKLLDVVKLGVVTKDKKEEKEEPFHFHDTI